MKILVPVASAALGGSQLSLLRLMESCPPERVTFRCWLFGEGPLMRALDERGIPWERLPRSWLRTPWGLGRLHRRLARERPDRIYLHASRLIALLARRLEIPCLERINMPRSPGAGGWCRFRLLDRLCTEWNTRALVVSAALGRQLVARGVAAEKITVFRDLIYPAQFRRPDLRASARARLEIDPGALVVLNIGRLVPQKAHEDYLAVAERFRARAPRFRFLLVGEGPGRADLEQQVRSRQLGDVVRMQPFQQEVAAFFAAADIYLQTARWEGLANVLLEAMAAGLGIVATDVDGTREALAGYEPHRLVTVGDVAAMTQAITAVAERLPLSAPPPFPAMFTPELVCRHFLEIMSAPEAWMEA